MTLTRRVSPASELDGGVMLEPKTKGAKNPLSQLKRVLIVEDDETLRR